MRLTRERLLNLTNSYLTKIVRKDPNIICIYLTGSMLNEDPFIGGTTDVDLVIVHNHPRDIPRQIVPITEEATLDIHFFQQAYYTPQRKIRLDPWVGPALCFDPVLLYGKGHWFEFTQAAIEAGFFQPGCVLQRSRLFFAKAFESYRELRQNRSMTQSRYILTTLRTIENVCNSVASLNGPPLTDRRILKSFKDVCEAVKIEDAVPLLNQLFLSENDLKPHRDYFLQSWTYYLEQFGKSDLARTIPKYHAFRLKYYTAAVETYWDEHLISALWLMLKTWSVVVEWCSLQGNPHYDGFLNALQAGLPFHETRESQLSDFIDCVDEGIERWGNENGFSAQESDFIQ